MLATGQPVAPSTLTLHLVTVLTIQLAGFLAGRICAGFAAIHLLDHAPGVLVTVAEAAHQGVYPLDAGQVRAMGLTGHLTGMATLCHQHCDAAALGLDTLAGFKGLDLLVGHESKFAHYSSPDWYSVFA
ncbi:hypothetical protein D3C71_1698320 [compost metagenome]